MAPPLDRRLQVVDLRQDLRGVLRDIPADELGVALDHRQEVVEIVRDAARELPNGFHLLGLPQLGL